MNTNDTPKEPEAQQGGEREPGFYWVKDDDVWGWCVAKWWHINTTTFEHRWYLMGVEATFNDSDFIEIGPRITRESSTPPTKPTEEEIERARDEWAESFKTGEWFERLRKEAFQEGAKFVLSRMTEGSTKKETE